METLTQTQTKISTKTKIIITAVAFTALGGIAAGLAPQVMNRKLPNIQYEAQTATLNTDGSVDLNYTIKNTGTAQLRGTFDIQFSYLKNESATLSVNQPGTLSSYVVRVRASGPEVINIGTSRLIHAVIPEPMVKRAGNSPWVAYMDVNNQIKESNEADNISALIMPTPPVPIRAAINIKKLAANPDNATVRVGQSTLLMDFAIEGKKADTLISSISLVTISCLTNIRAVGPTGTIYGSIDRSAGFNATTTIPLQKFVLRAGTSPEVKIIADTRQCLSQKTLQVQSLFLGVQPIATNGFDMTADNIHSTLTLKR